VVERGFVTIRNRANASMLDAKLTPSNQGKLWTKFVQAAMVLSNNLVRAGETKTPTELFFGKSDAKLLDYLQILGRIAYVSI
jgi:hypothetical protein